MVAVVADLPPDDPLTPWVKRVAEGAKRVEAAAAEVKTALGSARLVDQKAADDLVRRLAASADATAKATARAEVREGVRRQASWLAGTGVALVLLSLAAGFGWGRASVPECAAGRVRESGGARWCLLGQAGGAMR